MNNRSLRVNPLFAGLIALAAVLGSLSISTAAHADGSGIRVSHCGLCITGGSVQGSGSRVTGIGVSHTHGEPIAAPARCDNKAKAWGTLANGSAFSRTFGQQQTCILVAYRQSTSVNLDFRKGTNISMQAGHDGAWAGGVPTVAIQ